MASPANAIGAERISGWLRLRADRANPMLVRRVRQELRSKTFLGVFLLLLVLATGAAVVASAAAGKENGAGRGLFAFTATCWAAIMCFQAMGTHRAIAAERSLEAWDLLELTGLPPRRILSGVMVANLVMGLFTAAALAPFLVMAWLLRGIDLPVIAFVLLTMPLMGAILGAMAALFATFGNTRSSRIGLSGITGLKLLALWGMSNAIWFTSQDTLSPWLARLLHGDGAAWTILLAGLNVWLAVLGAAFVLGEAMLTHRALNRSTRPRAFAVLVWINGLLWIIGLSAAVWCTSGNLNAAVVLMGAGLGVFAKVGIVWAAVVGFFSVSEDLELTPRQQRELIEGGRLRRQAMTVLGPGACRGARLYLLLTGLSLVLDFVHLDSDPAWIIACYGAILLTVGDIVARTVLNRWCDTPMLRRACILGAMVLFMLVPPLAAQFVTGSLETWLLAMSPISGIAELSDGMQHGGREGQLTMVALSGCLAALVLLVRALRPARGTARVTASETDRNPRA